MAVRDGLSTWRSRGLHDGILAGGCSSAPSVQLFIVVVPLLSTTHTPLALTELAGKTMKHAILNLAPPHAECGEYNGMIPDPLRYIRKSDDDDNYNRVCVTSQQTNMVTSKLTNIVMYTQANTNSSIAGRRRRDEPAAASTAAPQPVYNSEIRPPLNAKLL